MGICHKMGETLEGESGFGRFDYCFQGPYVPTETLHTAAARNIKSLACPLMNSIARTITRIWRQLKRMGWDFFDDGWITSKSFLKTACIKCFTFHFQSLYTYFLLTYYERIMYKGSIGLLLFMPVIIPCCYLFISNRSHPDPDTTSHPYVQDALANLNSTQGVGFDHETVSSLTLGNWILFGFTATWALLAIFNHIIHWYNAADRVKIKGFRMTYIYRMHTRVLSIGGCLSCLLLASIPSCLGLGLIMLGIFGFLTLITFMMYICEKYGCIGAWNDKKLLKRALKKGFPAVRIKDLQRMYNEKYPAIELLDLGLQESSSSDIPDDSQSPSNSTNDSQAQSPPASTNDPQALPSDNSSGNLVNRPPSGASNSTRDHLLLRALQAQSEVVQTQKAFEQTQQAIIEHLLQKHSDDDPTN